MIIRNPKLEISAVSPKQYPEVNKPEIVLVGKSNVGKSSFINTMINRKALARTSNTPGKTRLINFYNIDDNFYFVDLPGYGYSKMSKTEEAKVGKFIEEYLFKRDNIDLIVHILDIRHDPTKDDILMYNYIKSTNRPCILIANKIDKLKPSQVETHINNIKNVLNLDDNVILLPFSSSKKIYTESVWEELEKYLNK